MQDIAQEKAQQLKEDIEELQKESAQAMEAQEAKKQEKKPNRRSSFKNLGSLLTGLNLGGSSTNKATKNVPARSSTRSKNTVMITGPALNPDGSPKANKTEQAAIPTNNKKKKKKKSVLEDDSLIDDLASSLSEAGGHDIIRR